MAPQIEPDEPDIESLDAEIDLTRRLLKKDIWKGLGLLVMAAILEAVFRLTSWFSDWPSGKEFIPPVLAIWGLLCWATAWMYRRDINQWPRERAELMKKFSR